MGLVSLASAHSSVKSINCKVQQEIAKTMKREVQQETAKTMKCDERQLHSESVVSELSPRPRGALRLCFATTVPRNVLGYSLVNPVAFFVCFSVVATLVLQ